MSGRPLVLFAGVIGGLTAPWCEAAPQARKSAAATYTYQKVVDTATSIPGGMGKFSGFYRPAISAGEVAFRAYAQATPDSPIGIYRWSSGGPITVVADQSSQPPGGPTFDSFLEPVISHGDVVFGGGFLVDGRVAYTGIYRGSGGTLDTLVDGSATIPGAVTQFVNVRGYNYRDGELVFLGQARDENGSGIDGIFRVSSGTPSLIADSDTPVPGAPTFTFWLFQSNPAFFGAQVAFSADNSFTGEPMTGVFLADADNTLSTVLNTHYSNYFDLSASAQRLSFCAAGSAVYQYRDGQLTQPVVIHRTRVPDAPLLPINAIGSAAVSGDAWAFTGGFQVSISIPFPEFPLVFDIPIHFGLYADFGGGWEAVVTQGTVIDGKRVRRITLGPQGFDGAQFVFRLDFTDGSQAIYVATRQ